MANQKLDECRRRVQNQTLEHRGRKIDPLYRARRLLTRANERLDERGRTRLLGLLDAGDPDGDVRTTWQATEVVRSIYDPLEFVTRLGHDSKISPIRSRSTRWAGPSSAGVTRSQPGTKPITPTPPPKQPTT